MGHPVNPLPEVRCADAVCAKYRRPAGVAFPLQVSEYSVEPSAANRRFNLLSKHRWRVALADEPIEVGPEVARVSIAEPFSRFRPRLAGARPGPDGSAVGPAGESQRQVPASDSGKEVAAVVSLKIMRSYFLDAPCIDGSWGDKPVSDQVAEPCEM